MTRFLGILLLVAAGYFCTRQPAELGLFGGWLSSKFHWGRVVAIIFGIAGVVLIFL